MSLFMPSHRKTYFETKLAKKKPKKKRKKRLKNLTENIGLKETKPSIQASPLPEFTPFIEKKQLIADSSSLKNTLIKDEYIDSACTPEKAGSIEENHPYKEKKHPDVSTYYDHLHMFSTPKPKPDIFSMVGKKAKLDYMSSYKNLMQFHNPHENSQSNSPILKYLHKIDEKKLPPIPMGIIKRKGNVNDIDLSMYSMGDSYAEALSEGIGMLSPVRLQLNDNRLSETGVSKILSKLSIIQLLELNLSNNKLSIDNLYQLDSLITEKSCILQILKLEGLNLRDKGCKIVCKALKKNKTLIDLNLAKNNIEGNKTLSSYISSTNSLQKLDLHWNLIRGQGANSLCSALCNNSSLKVLDLS